MTHFTSSDPKEILDLLIDSADELRASGFSKLEFCGIRVEFFEHFPAPAMEAEDKDDDDEGDYIAIDPLADPATYGGRFGGKIPGFSRKVKRSGDE